MSQQPIKSTIKPDSVFCYMLFFLFHFEVIIFLCPFSMCVIIYLNNFLYFEVLRNVCLFIIFLLRFLMLSIYKKIAFNMSRVCEFLLNFLIRRLFLPSILGVLKISNIAFWFKYIFLLIVFWKFTLCWHSLSMVFAEHFLRTTYLLPQVSRE